MRNDRSVITGNTSGKLALPSVIEGCGRSLMKRTGCTHFKGGFPLLVGFVSTGLSLSVRMRPNSRLTGGHRGDFNGGRV